MKTGHFQRALLIIVAIAGVIGGHGAILYLFSMHLTASVIVLFSAAVLLILHHARRLGALYTRWRLRSPRTCHALRPGSPAALATRSDRHPGPAGQPSSPSPESGFDSGPGGSAGE